MARSSMFNIVLRVFAVLAAYLIVCSVILSVKAFEVRTHYVFPIC